MADITQIFKSTVKMLKVRHRAVSSMKGDTSPDEPNEGKPTFKLKPSIGSLGGESDKSFSANIKEIVVKITGLKLFLLKNRKAYLAASSNISFGSGQKKLTEEERDKIDQDAVDYMKLCRETLANYKKRALHSRLTAQHREHRTSAFDMVEEYLKVVCQLYSEQKAIRVKRAVDRQNLSQLEYKKPKVEPIVRPQSRDSANAATPSPNSDQITVMNDLDPPAPPSPEISAEEAQLFKEENEQLYSELNSTLDEVRQIEGKVVEISRLQEIFTEKVLEQGSDMDRIADEVVHSTENVEQGNEEIREAMKNNAGMRVWIIFGICVLTFTLLFLDWYND